MDFNVYFQYISETFAIQNIMLAYRKHQSGQSGPIWD